MTKFKSRTMHRLLRDAPDLEPLVKEIEDLYQAHEDGLVPRSGKDEAYDEVQEEIATLESELEHELIKLEKLVGFVIVSAAERLWCS